MRSDATCMDPLYKNPKLIATDVMGKQHAFTPPRIFNDSTAAHARDHDPICCCRTVRSPGTRISYAAAFLSRCSHFLRGRAIPSERRQSPQLPMQTHAGRSARDAQRLAHARVEPQKSLEAKTGVAVSQSGPQPGMVGPSDGLIACITHLSILPGP